MIDHPARPVLTLEQGQALGVDGLNAIFTVGSRWHYGPARESMETIVEVLPEQAHHAYGLVDHRLPGRPASLFIQCRVIESPRYDAGRITGYPPHTLIPRAVVLDERGITEDPLAEALADLRAARAANEALQKRYEKSCAEHDALQKCYDNSCNERNALTSKLNRAKLALA